MQQTPLPLTNGYASAHVPAPPKDGWTVSLQRLRGQLPPDDFIHAQNVMSLVNGVTTNYTVIVQARAADSFYDVVFTFQEQVKLKKFVEVFHEHGVGPVSVAIPMSDAKSIVMTIKMTKMPAMGLQSAGSISSSVTRSAQNELTASQHAAATAKGAQGGPLNSHTTAKPAASSSAMSAERLVNQPKRSIVDSLWVMSAPDKANILRVITYGINADYHQPAVDWKFLPDSGANTYTVCASGLAKIDLAFLHDLLVEVPCISEIEMFAAADAATPASIWFVVAYTGVKKRPQEEDDDEDAEPPAKKRRGSIFSGWFGAK
jgi:hypothetical protein